MMIYENGSMKLLCLRGENEDTAYFLEMNSKELIKACGVVWSGESIHWNRGDYMGNIMQYVRE